MTGLIHIADADVTHGVNSRKVWQYPLRINKTDSFEATSFRSLPLLLLPLFAFDELEYASLHFLYQ